MHEEAVVLYAELAAVAMASFISSKDTPLMEPVRLNDGFEESRDALKKFRGENDDFQFLEYQVWSASMVRIKLLPWRWVLSFSGQYVFITTHNVVLVYLQF